MIAVDVYVPYTGSVYDFNLDERTPVSLLIREMVEIICQKERWAVPVRTDGLALFGSKHMGVLAGTGSLEQAGVKAGQHLILC